MRLICDTDVVLDVILHRQRHFASSSEALARCQDEDIIAFFATTSMAELYAVVARALDNTEAAHIALEEVAEIFEIRSPAEEDIQLALARRDQDFEQCLLAQIAKRLSCDYLLTRNTKGYEDYPFAAITPAGFLKRRT